MNWKFWNKKNKDVHTKEQLSKKGFNYRITVCDPLGESPREIDVFGASKTRDNDGVVWLENVEKGFKEVFPLDSDFNIRYSKEQIDTEIKKVENTKIKPNENKLNKEIKLLELNKLKKSLLNPKGSFIKVDKDGVPHLTYVRYKTSYIPLKYNLDMSYVHTPSEPLIKNVLTVQQEKMRKYNQVKENWLTGGMVVFLLILVAWTGVLGYFSVQWVDKVDDSKVQDLQERIDMCGLAVMETYQATATNDYQASVYNLNLTRTIYDRLNPRVDTTPQVTGIE